MRLRFWERYVCVCVYVWVFVRVLASMIKHEATVFDAGEDSVLFSGPSLSLCLSAPALSRW